MNQLTGLVQRAHMLGTVGELLGWDEQVNLPPGAAEQRAAQHAALAEAQHAAASERGSANCWRTLEARHATQLTEDQRAIVANARRDYDRATKLPPDFVREKAAQGSRGYHAWARAKAADDFASYAPVLEKNLEFARREAAYLESGDAPYDYMLDKHDPGLTAAAVDRLFGELKRELVPLVREITGSPRAARGAPGGGATAGVSGGGAADVSARGDGAARVRLRARADRRVAASVLFRHRQRCADDDALQRGPAARCALQFDSRNRSRALRAGPARGAPRDRAGDSRRHGGARIAEPAVGKPGGAQPRRSGGTSNRGGASCFRSRRARSAPTNFISRSTPVEPTLIRVDADEVTYNLHIVLRFEMEKKLFAGELAVRDLPEAWRAASRELVGLEPGERSRRRAAGRALERRRVRLFSELLPGQHDRGAALGARACRCVRRSRMILRGASFGWLLGWLRENMHCAGPALQRAGTRAARDGRGAVTKHLVRYLRERYGTLYRA